MKLKLISTFLIIGIFLFGCIYRNDTNSQNNINNGVYPIYASSNFSTSSTQKLLWPIDCKMGVNCSSLLYPDIDGDGNAYCGSPGYAGHTGTDISISWDMMEKGTSVYAAADGKVLWTFDGKYDRCVNFGLPFGIKATDNPDCAEPTGKGTSGYRVCTDLGDYCNAALKAEGKTKCGWCFAGGNVIVILHDANKTSGVFATRYDHLKNGSISVRPGEEVRAGQKIAEVGSAGRSGGSHLHFEVWTDYYTPVDPWAPSCGPKGSLWQYEN
jgi:murein DD-endopeptidase MepM/ murein hydrolase activator NlpD